MALARLGSITASGILFALAAAIEAPVSALVWMALVPWLLVLDRERSLTATLASAAAMSAVYTVAVFAWFAGSVSRYTEGSTPLAYLLLFLSGPLLQAGFLGFAATRYFLSNRAARAFPIAVVSALAWVGTEWLCPRLFGDTLGHSLYPFDWLRQGADIAGAPGLTFVILLVNQSLHSSLGGVRSSPKQVGAGLAAAFLMIALLSGYGAYRSAQVAETQSDHEPLGALLVQGNLENYDGLRERIGSFEAVQKILDTYVAMSDHVLDESGAGRPIDLLIWPESMYPTTFGSPKSSDGAAFDDEIIAFAARADVPLIFGTYEAESDREYNAAVLLHSSQGTAPDIQRYRKTHLFPLTEHVPAWLDSEPLRRRLPWTGTWHPGKQDRRVLTLRRQNGNDLAVAPLICLDAVVPSLAIDAARQGAGLLVVLSNDGWFADSRGARLHLVVSTYRSIETRLPQLRATNTGISAVITPSGEIVANSMVNQQAVLAGHVLPRVPGQTLMMRWGDWFGPFAACGALAFLLLALRRSRPRATDAKS